MRKFFCSLKFVVTLWAAIFIIWSFTMIYEWHFYYWWIDVLLHFVGGFWVLTLARYVANYYGVEIIGFHPQLTRFIVFISFVAFVGVLWEFFEFVLDRYITVSGFTYLAGVFEDTLLDLVMDILGGITAYILYFRTQSTETQITNKAQNTNL